MYHPNTDCRLTPNCLLNRLFRGVGEANEAECMWHGGLIRRSIMPAQPLVLDPTRLHLLSLSADSARITLHMRTCSDTAPCPQCGRLSARVHSRYCRTLADL